MKKPKGAIYCTNCEKWTPDSRGSVIKFIFKCIFLALIPFFGWIGLIVVIYRFCKPRKCAFCQLILKKTFDYADEKKAREKLHLKHNQEIIYGETSAKSKGYADGIKMSERDTVAGYENLPTGRLLTNDEILEQAERIKEERKQLEAKEETYKLSQGEREIMDEEMKEKVFDEEEIKIDKKMKARANKEKE